MIEDKRFDESSRPVATRMEAEALVDGGIWDPSGMDPEIDQIFDEGVIGVIKEQGEFKFIFDNPSTDQDFFQALSVHVRNFELFPDRHPEYYPLQPSSQEQINLIDDWET